jgi:hypothetical protein
MLHPFQGAGNYPLVSGGLRFASTTDYYLAAFQAEKPLPTAHGMRPEPPPNVR